MKPGAEYDRLYQAALCRERADWLVGINGTRLFSCLYRKTLNVGRVMTPTLAMVVLRDAQINSFQSEPFHTLQFDVGGMPVSSDRFKDKREAESVQEQCVNDGWIKVISVKRQEKTEHPPLLYDLTSLQRDANRILGYTAQQTLDYAQSLYEKKLITYPRTDSHYLTADMESAIPDLGDIVNCSYPHCHEGDYLTGKVINSQKVTDHHAIIPTKEVAKALLLSMPKGEQEILQLIAVRLLCAISDDYRYSETELHVCCAGTEFIGKCKETICLGWHEIRDCFYPPKKQESEKKCTVTDGAILPFSGSKIVEGKTHPPKHYTEDSLLSSMQNAAKEDMPEDAERQGIGTPATRAGIIEKLVNKGYIERYGNRKSTQLRATEKGHALITVMPEQLQAVSMTAEWEQRLLDIERGAFSPDEFIKDIQTSISELVANYKVSEGAEFIMAERTVIGTCPHCGNSVTESQKGWFCSNRSCRFVLWKENAFFRKIGKRLTSQIAKNLLSNGHSRLKDCKNQSTNKTYNATVHMTTDADGKPVFNLSFENGGDRRYEKKE